jgi:DNA-binding MarR family transcriptional regulator
MKHDRSIRPEKPAGLRTDAGAGAGSRARRYTSRDETVGFLIWDARRAYSRDFGERISLHGVSLGVFPVLRMLWDEDGLTQADLIRRGRMSGPTIVGIVAQLEREGMVTRLPDPADSRKKRIMLTPSGEAMRHVILPITEEVNRRALKGFSTQERAQLKDFLKRLRGNIVGG